MQSQIRTVLAVVLSCLSLYDVHSIFFEPLCGSFCGVRPQRFHDRKIGFEAIDVFNWWFIVCVEQGRYTGRGNVLSLPPGSGKSLEPQGKEKVSDGERHSGKAFGRLG